MKRLFTIIIVMIFSFSIPLLSYAGGSGGRKYQRSPQRVERNYRQNHSYHMDRSDRDMHGHMYGIYKKPHNRRWSRYKYRGHYRWNEWMHERNRPIYRGGHYHHDDNGHLMFSFCENQESQGMCFSIGID